VKRALPLVLILMIVARAHAQETKSTQQVAVTGTSTKTVSGQVTASSLTPPQIFSRARSSVVIIVSAAQKDQRQVLGSGFIVNHGRIVKGRSRSNSFPQLIRMVPKK
jgi:hypothetical protein